MGVTKIVRKFVKSLGWCSFVVRTNGEVGVTTSLWENIFKPHTISGCWMNKTDTSKNPNKYLEQALDAL